MTAGYNRRYDHLLKDIILTLKEDYAGYDEVPSQYQPTFYITACGTKFQRGEMNDLLFLQYASQMLATTEDRSLRLALTASEGYFPWTPGFFARRVNEALVITQVFEDARLVPGDEILAINGQSPASLVESMQKNFFYSQLPERELWHGLLKMAGHMRVKGKNGVQELELRRFPKQNRILPVRLEDLGKGVIYFEPGTFDGTAAAGEYLQRHGIPKDCRRLIIDLRRAGGDDEDDILPLLPFIAHGELELEQLLEQEPVMTNYTANNCICAAYPAKTWLEQNGPDEELDAYVKGIEDKFAAGWVQEPSPLWRGVKGKLQGQGPEDVVVITDTWCENAGEQLARLLKRLPNVRTIGRPTMGSLDYSQRVSKALDEGFVLTWPMSKSLSAAKGAGLKGKGLAVDEYLPFTAEEAVQDILLQKAIEL